VPKTTVEEWGGRLVCSCYGTSDIDMVGRAVNKRAVRRLDSKSTGGPGCSAVADWGGRAMLVPPTSALGSAPEGKPRRLRSTVGGTMVDVRDIASKGAGTAETGANWCFLFSSS
jgi:hypothetical protein